MINHTVTLDMRKQPGHVPPRLTMRRGESQTQKITATLTDGGAAYTPTYQSARLCLLHADGTWARCAATVSGSTVTATLTSDMLNGVGRCRLAYFEFYSSNGYSETTENIELVILSNVDTSGEAAKDYSDEMDALYKKMAGYLAIVQMNENLRVSNENKRVSNETARVSSEKTRVSNESTRVSSEAARKEAETTREANETARVKAETKRETDSAAAVSKANTAANSASEATDAANAAAADAHKAADEARGAVSPDMKIYFKRVTDAQGNSRPVLVDMTV